MLAQLTDIRSLSLPIEVQLENRSPTLPVRWILNLPQGSVYTGTLSHRGTLPPGGRASVQTHAWVCEPGRVPLGGWEVIRETGDADGDVDGGATGGESGWTPRMSWIGAGGGSVEVVAA